MSVDSSEREANRRTDRTLFPGAREAPRRSGLATDSALAVAAGAGAGLLGGVVTVAVAGGHPLRWAVFGTGFGAISGAFASRHLTTPGQALVRGLGLAVFVWVLALAILGVVQGGMWMGMDPPVAFPLFVRLVVGLGVPVGVAVGLVGTPNWWGLGDGPHPLVSGVVSGGVSAVSGGSLFGGVMTGNRTARLLGAVVGSEGPAVGVVLYLGTAAAIGALFGLLFGDEARSAGSSLAYGFGYGLLWWLLGALTILPLLRTGTVAWQPQVAGARLGQFVEHGVFGVQLGASYALLNWAYRGLFYSPDPVQPGTGGVSVQVVRDSLRGVVASLVGVVGFGLVLWETGQLRTVAGLVGRSDPIAGSIVHLTVGAVIGGSYGLLFAHESPDIGAGVLWGTVYGLVWWLVGALTLLPLLSGAPVGWTADAVATAFPLLIGHVVYGALTGVAFTLMERRRAAWAAVDPRTAEREQRRRRPFTTAAPSVWLFVIGTTVIAPATLL